MERPALLTFAPFDTPEAIDEALEALTARVAGWRDLAPRAAAEAAEAAERLSYPRAAARALVIQAQAALYGGELARTRALLDAAAPVVEADGTDADAVYLRSLEAHLTVREGDLQAGLQLIRSLEDQAVALGPCPVQAIYFHRRDLCESAAGNFLDGLRAGLRTLAIGRELDEVVIRANAMSNLGSSFFDGGDYERARELLEATVELIRLHGIPDLAMPHTNLALTLLELGEYESAWEQIQLGLEATSAEKPRTYAFRQLIAAEILVGLKRSDDAKAILDAMVDFTVANDLPDEALHARVVAARLALVDGDVEAALVHVEEADAIDAELPFPYLLELMQTKTEALEAAGRVEEARRAERLCTALRNDRDRTFQMALEAATARAEAEALNVQLATRLGEVEQLRLEMAELAVRDPLTDLFNRRYFNEYMRELAGRPDSQFALVMVDLDHFKAVNDTHGHATGDVVLRRAADHLRYCVRAGDLVSRYGGEEFCVVLHRVDAERGASIVRGILASYQQLLIEHGDALITGLTFSAGVASYPTDGTDVSELLKRADEAMYEVKRASRNAVRVANGAK